jgi:hypothetical protein
VGRIGAPFAMATVGGMKRPSKKPSSKPVRRSPSRRTEVPIEIRESSGAWKIVPLDRARPLGSILEDVWAELCEGRPATDPELEQRMRAKLEERWTDLVGERLVPYLRLGPTEGRDGRMLTLWARHSAVVAEARAMLDSLLARIREACPDAPWQQLVVRLNPEGFDDARR